MSEAHIDTKNVVKSFIMDKFLPGEDPDALTNDTPLITGGILDSIATISLVSFLEERFDVKFEAHEMSADHLDSIDLIAETLDSKR